MKKRILLAVSALLVLLILGLLLGSYFIFGTANFVKVTDALVAVSSGKADYVEMSSAPNRIVLAAPDQSYQILVEALEAEGYTIHEEDQTGSLHHISKDGKSEYLFFRVNGVYALWKWKP